MLIFETVSSILLLIVFIVTIQYLFDVFNCKDRLRSMFNIKGK